MNVLDASADPILLSGLLDKEFQSRDEEAAAKAAGEAKTEDTVVAMLPEEQQQEETEEGTEVNLDSLKPLADVVMELTELREHLHGDAASSMSIPRECRMITLEMGLHKIMSAMYMACLDRAAPAADAGYNELMVEVSDPLSQCPVAKCASRCIRLNFLGPLSFVPSIGSFKICSLDGQDVFMRSNVRKGPLCDFLSPAWLVPRVPLHEETGQPMKEPSMEVGKSVIEVDFQWAKCFLGSKHTLKIPVSVFFLTVASKFIGKQNLQLTRSLHACEILEHEQTTTAFNAAMSQRLKSLKNSTGPAGRVSRKQSKEEKNQRMICKHILT